MTREIPDAAQYVVIGGGVVGAATAYHLAKSGARDVILIEKDKLTSGSSWHAAGAVAQYRANANLMALVAYGVDLYSKLEAETGQATGWRPLGGCRVTASKERRAEFLRAISTARSFGLDMELISPREAKDKFPLLDITGLDCGLWIPSDGQVGPSDVTMALVKGARMHGARVFEDTSVTGFTIVDGRIAGIETSKGPIRTESVAICAGIWSRALGRLAGANIPILPSHHCYFITDKIAGLGQFSPFMRDPDLWHYFRAELGGLMVGQYDADPVPYPGGFDIAADHAFKLMPENLEHFMPTFEPLMQRLPVLRTVGVRSWFHGIEAFTEDQQPVLGETPEVRGLFVGAGFNAYGISAGGGFGMALAHWMAEGEPPHDLWASDIRRFSAVQRSDRAVTARGLEGQGRHYKVHFPYEDVHAGRPLRRSPLYDRLRAKGAVFGEKSGWERANWFAPEGVEPADRPSFGTQIWRPHVAEEHKCARERAVLFDLSSFAKGLLVGRDAEPILQGLACCDMALRPGRIRHTLMLNRRGGIETDMTVARLSERQFYLVTGSAFATHDFGHIRRAIPTDADAELIDVTSGFGVLALMGPRSRDILRSVCEHDLGNAAFPFGTLQEVIVAGAPVRALRITFVGELGWELHVPSDYVATVYDALVAAGAPHGMRDAGYRALDGLRLEKAYKAWAADIGPDFTPYEAGLSYAISWTKSAPFVGRDALLAQRGQPLGKRMVTFTVDDPDVLLLGRETIYRNGERVGWLTSGGFGHTVGKPIGLGYLRVPGGITDGFVGSGDYELEVATERVAARAHLGALHDPDGLRIKA